MGIYPDVRGKLSAYPAHDCGLGTRNSNSVSTPTRREKVINEKEIMDTNVEDEEIINRQWTTKLRRKAVGELPPQKLLPDSQPAYVSSWIYVFGVLTLSALGVVAISGAILALFGPSWWQQSPEGHFVNSLHLWSVELFFFFMVVHLWGKFFMAAWRGKRALTWITGAISFLVSIGAAFTGYLSQQNFDSQWIATQGKDGMNSIGIGAFFNLMNFGQMFMWHILLLPLLVVIIVGIHILGVRAKGVVPPIGALENKQEYAKAWSGKVRPYDIIKEGTIALVIVSLLTVALSVVFSSPNKAPLTIQRWAKADPTDFVTTAATELAGTSFSGSYGPPYNNGNGALQYVGPISLQKLAGVRIPINSAQDFVLQPLATIPNNPTLKDALNTYEAATPSLQNIWNNNFAKADAKLAVNGNSISVPKGNYGPIPVLMKNLLTMANTGGLDADLENSHQFYGTDYTKPLLFMADGNYMATLAQQDHLTGDQWGMMNETDKWPGQPWLWLYTMWYQIPPMSTSSNADALVMSIMVLLTIGFASIPFIPGVRTIPEKVGLYKLIWRDFYKDQKSTK